MAPFRELVETWSSIYANSAAMRSALSFAHIGALVTGGGCAIAADLSVLRATRRSIDRLGDELQRLAGVHRIVISSLAVVIVSGVCLVFADLDAYLESRVFWIKMALVAGLTINGALLMRSSARAASEGPAAAARLRLVSLASVTLWMLTTLLGAVLPNVL
jgi:uncharacterized membrane protein